MRAFPANIAVNTGGRFVPRVETKAANTGYRAALGVSLAVLFLCGSAAGPLATAYLADRRVDIGRIADQWPERFDLVGSKTEPTWVEYVKLSRRGDLFLLEGGGLAGLEQAVEGVEVDKNGTIRHVHCPPMRDCSDSGPLSGFLASAQFVAYHRAGLLSGSADVVAYGDRHVFCLPGEAIGVKDPIPSIHVLILRRAQSWPSVTEATAAGAGPAWIKRQFGWRQRRHRLQAETTDP
jgi:hypothetical protein